MKTARELAEYINADLYYNDDIDRIEIAIRIDRAEVRREAIQIIRDLCKGLELWAGDEDGIHELAFESYKEGKAYLDAIAEGGKG